MEGDGRRGPGRSASGERLQKVLARSGLGSRRAVEGLIAAGRVTVNGAPVELGRRVDPTKDRVELDGFPVPVDATLLYYLLNKPAGVVSTASDPAGRPTAVELVDAPRRVWPVGRLDVHTEGALVLTNDGELTQRLTHPSFEVTKTYVAEVKGSPGRAALRKLAAGVELDDGPTAPAHVRLLDRRAATTLVELAVHEGRNRLVRRMLDAVGHPVVRLVRVSVGPLELGRLKPGAVRRLSPAEVRALYGAGGGERRPDPSTGVSL
jgi:23S rRNA pseudouridine2605 synthase